MKTVALIPIRAGSKGIPNKNMKKIAGKPLYAWVVQAALAAKPVDEVWVSTDSQKYTEDIYECYGDSVKCIKRPAWLATDTATSDDVLRHFCWETCKPGDRVVMLQATSPMTTSGNIKSALELMGKDLVCVVSVVIRE